MKLDLHKNSKIIILDDEPSVAEFTAVTLTEIGFLDVDVFSSAKPCIEKIRCNQVDLVFLDINLHEIDGLVLLGWIKLKQPNATVIMFSGDTREDFVKEASQLGAAGFLSKFELDKNIRQLLNKWHVNYPLT
jgi:DNA-binding NtrC family response regulator